MNLTSIRKEQLPKTVIVSIGSKFIEIPLDTKNAKEFSAGEISVHEWGVKGIWREGSFTRLTRYGRRTD